MIKYILAGLGLILLIVTIICFKKNKMTLMGRILLGALTVGVFGLSGLSFYSSYQKVQKDKESVYLALRYIENLEGDAARIHLNQIKGANKHMTFFQSAGEVLLEEIRNNDTMASLKLRILKETGDYNSDESDILTYMEANDLQTEDHLQTVIKRMTDMLKLKEAKETEYAAYYEIEYASVCGYGAAGLLAEYEENYGNKNTAVLEINDALAGGNKESALLAVSERVAEEPNEENRLLLAEVIAQMAYEDYPITDQAFGAELSEQTKKERERLQKSYDKNYKKLESVQAKLDVASGEKKIESLTEKKQKLYDTCTDLQDRMENLYVYRAINAVSDIPSLEARVVESRLYYSIGQQEAAVDVLVNASDSMAALLSDNTTLADGLHLIQKAYGENKGSLSGQSPEFADAVSSVLNINSQGLMAVNFSKLSTNFVQKIVGDLKYEDNNIYVLNLDDSKFPEVQVTLGAREDILAGIAEKTDITAKDTRYVVEYQVEKEDKEENTTSIGFVVDVSGSMGGEPIANVRLALDSFVQGTDAGQEMAMVTFDDEGQVQSPITTDKAAIQASINSLYANGGTNIDAGIRVGTEVLRESSGIKVMMLLTDGQSSVSDEAIMNAKAEGITIYTIGFGGVNDEVLQYIADSTGGRYVRADSYGELGSVYNSLADIIGNSLTITYTVTENLETPSRYFFLNNPKQECSVHYVYMDEADAVETTMRMDEIYPQLVTKEDIADEINKGREYSFNINGAGLSQVSKAFIGDMECTVQPGSDYYVNILIPKALQEGTYEVRLETEAGDSVVRTEGICVYKQGEQALGRKYRLGSMIFEPGMVVYLQKGRMVFSGANMHSTKEKDTFSASAHQLIYVNYDSTVQLPADEDVYTLEYIDLGDSGSFTMDGVIYLNGDDPAAGNRGGVVMAAGYIQGTCDAEQCHIAPVAE